MDQAAYGSDSFHLEIDGISAGNFVSCSGLGAKVEVLEYAEGGAEEPVRLRGRVTFDNIVLERGVVRSRDLYEWFLKGDRRDGAIVMVSPAGEEILRWAFVRGWPCRWEGPLLDASRAEVALELLEITHEGLRWIER